MLHMCITKVITVVCKASNQNNICEYCDTYDKIFDYVSKVAEKGDIVVTMGAGDICKYLDRYNFE